MFFQQCVKCKKLWY